MKIYFSRLFQRASQVVSSPTGKSIMITIAHSADDVLLIQANQHRNGIGSALGRFGGFIARALNVWGDASAEHYDFIATRRILASDPRPTGNGGINAVNTAIAQWSIHSAEGASFAEANRILK